MYQGVNASEGIGIGTVMVAVDPDLTFEPHEVADSAAEKERYQSALSVFCEKTQAQADHMKETVGEAEAEIMSGHIVLAQDPGMTDAINAAIDGGTCAEQALMDTSTMFENMFLSMDDEMFRLRAADIADILDQSCMLLISANVSIVDFSMSNGGDAFPVSFPHNEADHDAGVATGMTNIPHPMMASGTLQAAVNGDPPMDSPLDLPDANLPPMAVDLSGNGSAMTLTWANDNFNIASSSFDITMPLMITVNLDIVGLNGTLTLAP